MEGANSDCNKAACCHSHDYVDARSTNIAKKLGDLNCYMPTAGFQALIDGIKANSAFDTTKMLNIIVGGGTYADLPQYVNASDLATA